MSHLATIYGVITSAMAGSDDHSAYHRLNRSTIDELPADDEYPPLTRPMFSITEGTSLSWQTRAIHFGWTTKNFDSDVADWILKFEHLLMRLYWWEARVQMELEIYGRIEIHWNLSGDSVQSWRTNGLELPNQWQRTIHSDAGITLADSLGQQNA